MALVEEIANRLLRLVPYPRYRALAWRPEPEVSIVEQEVDSVLLRLDRVVDGTLSKDGELRYSELETARRAGIGTHFALDLDRCLLGKLPKPGPAFRRNRAFYEYSLEQPCAVPQHDEGDLA